MSGMMYPYRYENPFNVEAEWICHLRTLDKILFYQPDLRKTLRLPSDLEDEVEALFQTLPHTCDGKFLIRYGIPPDEKLAVQQWVHYSDFLYMLRFLGRYTEKLRCNWILSSSYFFSITHEKDGTPKEFESLNSNAEETGLFILPKIQTIHDPLTPAAEEATVKGQKKHWATDRIPGIQDELSHTFYVDMNELMYKGHRYRAAHSVLQRHMFPEGKKHLRIAVCPVAHKDLLRIRTYDEESRTGDRGLCSAEGLKCPQFVHDKIRGAFLRACGENVDFLVFPEMLGDETILNPAFFSEIREEIRNSGYQMPGLILLPTWWHDHQNELYVLDASGKRLCIQQKQTAYLFEDETGAQYAEDLREPEQVIHMVHIPDVGILAFPICKDFLEDEYVRMMLRQLRATFLLCPSYSPYKTQFDLTAPGVIQYGCYSVWCNTCAAYYKSSRVPNHIGVVTGPQESLETMRLLSPACGGSCGDEEHACIFLVEISMDRSGSISCRHIYK